MEKRSLTNQSLVPKRLGTNETVLEGGPLGGWSSYERVSALIKEVFSPFYHVKTEKDTAMNQKECSHQNVTMLAP